MNVIQLYLYSGLTLLFAFLLFKNIITVIFSLENYSTYKKRQRQLHSHGKKTISDEEFLDALTKPIINNLFDKLKPTDIKTLEKNLRMVNWDKKITALQFKAVEIITPIIGLIIFLIFYMLDGKFFGLLLGVVLAFLPKILLKNEVNNVTTTLMADFPDFIRITQGYLTIDQPFVTCVENSLKFVGPAWQPILQEFIVMCNTRGTEDGLGWLQEKVNIFEVKEFVSMVKLSLEQGGDTKKSFNEQANKIHEILQDIIRIKIEKRKIMSVAIQAPLLICCFLTFGLPVFGQMSSLGL